MKVELVGVEAEIDNLRTSFQKLAKESTILSGKKTRMVEEVRRLSTEREQLMTETAKERKRAEADRMAVRAEIK